MLDHISATVANALEKETAMIQLELQFPIVLATISRIAIMQEGL
jgi:hypothetical protein